MIPPTPQLSNQPFPLVKPNAKPYAHLSNTGAFESFVKNQKQAAAALGNAIQGEPSKDAALANLEDSLKRGGGLAIATLATLGLARKVFGVGEFLGFASWFGAMAATPKVINGIVQLKTGVNLNQKYHSTYGEEQPLFKDPNYLPLHIVPDKKMQKAARKLGIDPNGSDWRTETEDRLRQVAAQSRTWWMLVAGPATPVISGLTCDLLQDPVTALLNKAKLGTRQLLTQRTQNAASLEKHVNGALDQMIGELPESELSRWWKKFSRQMVKETGLDKALGVKQAINASREEMIETLVSRFEGMTAQAGNELADNPLRNIAGYIEAQRESLTHLQERAETFLQQQEGRVDDAVLARNRSYLQTRAGNAFSTLNHYDQVIKGLEEGSLSSKQLRALLEKPVLPEVDKLIRQGDASLVRKLVGNETTYKKLRGMMEIRQYGRAFKLMGASPRDHLLLSTKDFMLRRLWRRRIPGALGGGLMLATLAFVGLQVGKAPKPKAEAPKPDGGHFA